MNTELGDYLSLFDSKSVDHLKELAARYRTLYSDYRMKSAVAPGAPETLAVLDEMIALGLAENTFHKWALREKERVTAPAKEESK